MTAAPHPALAGFSPAAAGWFGSNFVEPTPPQVHGWPVIAKGDHTLILAPTGSGKTLSAFFWGLDQLTSVPPPDTKEHRTRILYISPLRALAVDVEKNLRAPLQGMRLAADRLGETFHEPVVALRTGDTSAKERRHLATHPPDLLITTPESLYLMLTSKVRETLAGVETVIIDEIHALAGTKRGAHMAITLERLEQITDRPPQRIGLSPPNAHWRRSPGSWAVSNTTPAAPGCRAQCRSSMPGYAKNSTRGDHPGRGHGPPRRAAARR